MAAASWLETGSPCCYDPALSAGYQRTAVVDGGARPFELFLLAPGCDAVAAYKVGLAVAWWLLPLGYWLAFRSSWGLHGIWWGLCFGLGVVAISLVLFVRARGPSRIALPQPVGV